MRARIFTAAILMIMIQALAFVPQRSSALAGASSFEMNASRASTVAAVYLPASQSVIIIPEPVVVAPNQPAAPPNSTVGIINALCDVTLNIVGCLFAPTAVTLNCDTNADGVAETSIPLKDIRLMNRLLVRATLPALSPSLPGTAFPLACCGGVATITLSRTFGAGDDNIFGPFTQTQTCPIDLGLRAPVVVSATPSDADCSIGQNVLIPGFCFILPDGKPNVTSVFAVERGNPNNIVPASRVAIMNPNLIDAYFEFGLANSGKVFLIYASGPNGTSRNLRIQAEAPAGCVLGNEQGVLVSITCRSGHPPPSPGPAPRPQPLITGYELDRDETGAYTLSVLVPTGIPDNSTVSVGGVIPKKVRFKDPVPDTAPQLYQRVILKGKLCKGLPGNIVVTVPGRSGEVFAIAEHCSN